MRASTSPDATGHSKKRQRKEAYKRIRHQEERIKADQTFVDACQELLNTRNHLRMVVKGTTKPKTRTEKKVDRQKREVMRNLQTGTSTLRKQMRQIEGLTNIAPSPRTSLSLTTKRWWETLLFYGFLIGTLIVAGTLLGGSKASGPPRNIMGYSVMTVLSKSMERVYPKDSLIVTQVTEPNVLVIGDDITYLKENNTTVTHRIVAITENYMDTGARGFETKGVENPASDEEIVRAENVVGKVLYSSLFFGELLLFVRENLILTAVIGCLFFYLIDLLIKYITLSRTSKTNRKKRRRNAMKKKK